MSIKINSVSLLVSSGVTREQIQSPTKHQRALSPHGKTLFFSKTGTLRKSIFPFDDDKMLTF